MLPIVVHQSKEYSQDPHQNIPLEWAVHHTPSEYMDRYGWLKPMTQFFNICDKSPVNNQIILFNGHNSHFNDRDLTQMKGKNIQPFILKGGDSINAQPKDNGSNSKLKTFCNISKDKWMLKNGNTIFKPRHMKSVLVETW